MKQELKKVFIDIMEYQMNYVQLARTTEPYKLAERGLKLLEESEVKKLSKADVSGRSELLRAYFRWHKEQGFVSHKDSDIDEFLASNSH